MEPQNNTAATGEDAVLSAPIYEAAVAVVRHREYSGRLMEIYLWLVASVAVGGGIIFDIVARREPPVDVFAVRYLEFLLAFITVIFPFVFRLIFGALPLESIRRKRAQRQLEAQDRPEEIRASSGIREAEIRVLSDAMSTENLSSAPATKLFAYYASSSRRLSQSIYSRAGVYLLVGVFVAFSGLAFFYSQTVQLAPIALEGLALLITLAPKFGILFFIELVAFFFLRQYRAAMDEFRYYEAIKRNREETLALIRIAVDTGKPFDPIDLVKNESFFSKAGVLDKGQSSEIIESRKLEKNELDLLEKVIDVVSRSKK
jgi:hypothetical protein